VDSLWPVSEVAIGFPECDLCPVRACADAPIRVAIYGAVGGCISPASSHLESESGPVPRFVAEFEELGGGCPDVLTGYSASVTLPAASAGSYQVEIETRIVSLRFPGSPTVVRRQRVSYDVLPDCRVELRSPRPNPLSSYTDLAMNLPQVSDVEVTVHDLLGRRVATVARGRFGPGENHFFWDGAGAVDGVYFVRFTVDGRIHSKRLTVRRGGR